MKLSAFQRISRRDLVKALGGAALVLPHLELFERSARAQTAPNRSKYIVFCYTPDGVSQAAFWPTGTETSFTLSKTLSAFEPYKSKMLLIGPQMMNATTRRQGTGLAYISRPPQHQAPVTLTARIGKGCNTGAFPEQCLNGTGGLPYVDPQTRAVNRVDGPSIDQVIAKAVKGDSVLASVNLGLHPVGGDTPSDINFDDSGSPLQRHATADDAWRYVFGTTTGVMPPVTASPLAKHNAVSNFLHARFTALRPAISAADRRKLDGHLTALTQYEAVVKARLGGVTTMPPATECMNPMRAMVKTDADSIRTGADTETLSPFFMDIIATAFNCNLTKVASVTFGYPGGGDAGGLRMPWLGFTDPMHFVSHHANNATKLDRYQQMNQWVAGQVAGLMQRLAARPSSTGTGTLLDETTIYWFNRHGDGDAHDNYGLPNIILGGTGGYFKMGRWLQLPATNPTKVLISLAHAMGVPLTSFGEPAFMDTSPLAALTG